MQNSKQPLKFVGGRIDVHTHIVTHACMVIYVCTILAPNGPLKTIHHELFHFLAITWMLIHTYTHTYVRTCMGVYVYIYMCVCEVLPHTF